MESLARAANRAAKLLGDQETSGWALAKLTANRVFTSKKPTIYNRERDEGRVSSREWAEAVAEASGRSWSFSTVATYARCWRRYGETRLVDTDGLELPFYEHLWAANERAETVDDDSLADFRERNGQSLTDRKATKISARTSNAGMSYTPSNDKVMAAIRSNPDLVREIVDDDQTRSTVKAALSASVARNGNDGDPVLQELRVAIAAVNSAATLKARHGVTVVEDETKLLNQLIEALRTYPTKLASAV